MHQWWLWHAAYCGCPCEMSTDPSKLEQLNIISQISTGKRNRVYCATQILEILEEPANITANFDAIY